MEGSKLWSSEEQERFHEALRKFGKNYQAIGEHIGTKNIYALKQRCKALRKHLRENPEDENNDLLDILNSEIEMTEDEKDKVLEAHLVYGNDYEKIAEHVGTRSTKEIKSQINAFISM